MIANNRSGFLSTAHILALNSILLYKLMLENSAGSMIEKVPSQYNEQHKNFAPPSLLNHEKDHKKKFEKVNVTWNGPHTSTQVLTSEVLNV